MSFMLYYMFLIVLKYVLLKGNTSSKRSRGRPSRRVQIEFYLLNDLVDVLPSTAEQKELERIGLGGYFY